jgi:hypothetical protein
MKSFFRFGISFAALLAISGCYQVHSDDDLRSVPVTNNPHVVPGLEGMNPFIAMPQ